MNLPVWLNDTGYQAALITKYGPELGAAVYQEYPSSRTRFFDTTWLDTNANVTDYASPWWAFATAWRDDMLTCPARNTARMISPKAPTFLYQFTHVITETDIDPFLGAFHGVEIPFVFKLPPVFIIDNIPIVISIPEQRLQAQVSQLWVNFATNRNPNIGPAGLNMTWPVYTTQTDPALLIDLSSKVISGLEHTKCNFWDAVSQYKSDQTAKSISQGN